MCRIDTCRIDFDRCFNSQIHWNLYDQIEEARNENTRVRLEKCSIQISDYKVVLLKLI